VLILDSFDAPSLIKRGKSPAPLALCKLATTSAEAEAGTKREYTKGGMHPREKKARSKNYLPSERKKARDAARERRVHLMIVDAEAETKGRHITVRTITQE